MAPSIEKKKNFSSDNRRLIFSTAIGDEHEQQQMGSLMTSIGRRRSVRIAKKMNKRILRKIWICTDVWMDILPFFDRPQLGLKLALLSPRFNALVDKHFDGKSELTIMRSIEIEKGAGLKPKLSVVIGDKSVPFPLADRPLRKNIRFKCFHIPYIDHSVIAFLRSNKHIFDGTDTKLDLYVYSYRGIEQPLWRVFAREIWPIFAPTIRRLGFRTGAHLHNLCRRTSPTILTDLNRLNSIDSGRLFPADVPNDEHRPNPTAGQEALSKWLHTPTDNGQPKRLCFETPNESVAKQWVDNFRQAFLRATTSSACYKIQFTVYSAPTTSMVPFELVNERTKEKLTLISKASGYGWDYLWVMKRCQIGETATVQWEDENLNSVLINLCGDKKCKEPLSPTVEMCGSEK